MKKTVLMLSLLLLTVCGCVSKPQTVQQKLAGRLDFARSTSYHVVDPVAVRSMAEEYLTEVEFLAAQRKDRQLILEISSLLKVLYHSSGMEELLIAGESSRPLSVEKGAQVWFNSFSALAAPGAQGFLWHLFGKDRMEFRSFVDTLPGETLFAACFEFTPEALAAALAKYGDITPKEFDDICRKRFQKSTFQFLQDFSGRWEFLLFSADGKLHYKLSFPDRAGNFAAGSRFVLPLWKRFVPQSVPVPQFSLKDKRLIITSAGAEKVLEKAEKLVKVSPDMDYLIRQLPPAGNGFFYYGSDFSKQLLPEKIARRGKCKLPFAVGVLLASGEAYDLQCLSNCDINELQLFAGMILPLRKNIGLWQAEQQKMEKLNKINKLHQELGEGCAARLNVLGKKLQAFANTHQGRFPETLTELDMDGSAFLCPATQYSPYVYFSGFTVKDNPALPLVCDFQPHGEAVNVLLLNGKNHILPVGKNYSLKRLVSILHARFKYSEKELQMLLKKISTIEKNMEQ